MAVDPQALETIRNATRLSAVMPDVTQEIEGMIHQMIIKMDQHVQKGTLTPALAEAGWRDISAFRRLLNRLDTRVKVAVSAGEQIAPKLTL